MSKLLRSPNFFPFFWTQFLGAFTDNVFKNAYVVMLVLAASSEGASGIWVTAAQGLFILPFFFFSPIAGQICDKYSKSVVIQKVKLIEIGIMGLAVLGFVINSPIFLMFVLFLMGTQSTFFGPVKFSILPQTLKREDIMEGTGLVEMGTFLAILLGTIIGGLLAPKADSTMTVILLGAALLSFSSLGYLFSRKIPYLPGMVPELKLSWNPVSEFKSLYQLVHTRRSVYYGVIGISWFWFFGASVLSLFPNLVKFLMGGNESLITLFLAMFSISIGVGSVLCEKLSHTDIEIGMLPVGAIGMSIFTFHLGIADFSSFKALNSVGIAEFISYPVAWRILFDLFMLGFFGSFFIVPLYALIQSRSPQNCVSRVIAANNIANAIFMVASALIIMLLYAIGLTSANILVVLALMNLVVGVFILAAVPEFLLRFGVWALAKTIYRLKYEGRSHVPMDASALVIANHISFIDWFIISAACQRPVRFVMHYSFFKIPIVQWVFKAGGVIPIAQESENPEIKKRAFELIDEGLKKGDLVCIFPEGAISRDGELDTFRPGVTKILESCPVPVVPIAISGLWGSYFSRFKGSALSGMPKPKRRKITVDIGSPMDPADVTTDSLKEKITQMLKNRKSMA